MNERNYFAAAALTGMLADGEIGYGRHSADDIASKAFEIADAMIRAKDRGDLQDATRKQEQLRADGCS